MSRPPNPRVFISYSHDHRAHCDRVLAFAQQLRRDGISAELDQFHQEELLHWPHWCEEQMRSENADFVLCVCTAEYARRVENRTAADVGKGVFWESRLIYDELYDAKGNLRCVPVLLGGAEYADIPRVLKNYNGFRIDGFGLDDAESGYARLYRMLTRQVGVTGAEVGPVVPLPPGDRKMDFTPLQARWSAYYQLSRPPEHFTGRTEVLAELCAALREQAKVGGAVGLSAVNGMGGTGKTALALMVGQAVRDDFPDMQLFLELRSHSNNPASAGQVRNTALHAIKPEVRLPDNEDACWRLYASLFHDAASGKPLRALVVVDDAKDDEQVRLLSPPTGCALLVTSRQQLQTGRSFHLDHLPRAEAMALLQVYAPRLTDEQASCLAELCGDLPVALKTAGSFLKQYRSKPAEVYLDELQKDRLRRLGNKSQPNEDVNLVFDYSYLVLEDIERRAWTALSIMPASFDREAGKSLIAAVCLPGWLLGQLFCRATPDIDDLLVRLVCFNLLDYNENSDRFDWHDLLRDYANKRLSHKQTSKLRLAHAKYYLGVIKRASELMEEYKQEEIQEGWVLFCLESNHFKAAVDFLKKLKFSRYKSLVNKFYHNSCVIYFSRNSWNKDAIKIADDLITPAIAYEALGEKSDIENRIEKALKLYEETRDPIAKQVRKLLVQWRSVDDYVLREIWLNFQRNMANDIFNLAITSYQSSNEEEEIFYNITKHIKKSIKLMERALAIFEVIEDHKAAEAAKEFLVKWQDTLKLEIEVSDFNFKMNQELKKK